MPRDLTPEMEAAADAPHKILVYLVEMLFDSGPLRLHTGIGNLTFQGETYRGTGQFGQISNLSEVGDLSAAGINFELTGCDPQIVALALDEQTQGRVMNVYVAYLGTDWQLLDTPAGPFKYYLDTMEIRTAEGESTVRGSAENANILWERPNPARYTLESHQLEYPGDLFHEFDGQAAEKEIFWPKEGENRTPNFSDGPSSGAGSGSEAGGGSNPFDDFDDDRGRNTGVGR